ncbi:MAG: hypothetical protein ACRCXT_08680 [Paraclostridium sp.]
MRKLNVKELDMVKGIFQQITILLNQNRDVYTLQSDIDFRRDFKIIKRDGMYTILDREIFNGCHDVEIFNSEKEIDLLLELKKHIC